MRCGMVSLPCWCAKAVSNRITGNNSFSTFSNLVGPLVHFSSRKIVIENRWKWEYTSGVVLAEAMCCCRWCGCCCGWCKSRPKATNGRESMLQQLSAFGFCLNDYASRRLMSSPAQWFQYLVVRPVAKIWNEIHNRVYLYMYLFFALHNSTPNLFPVKKRSQTEVT